MNARQRQRCISGIRLHMLRHALASTMLAAGVPMLTVQAFLGHKDVTTTLATYGHLLPSALGDAATAMDGVWGAAREKAEAEAERSSADGVMVALRRESTPNGH